MNKSVGERELLLNGRRFILRPDFSALEMIEDLTKKTIMQLMASFTNAALMSAKDICFILYATAKSGDDKFNYSLNEFAQLVIDEGVYEQLFCAAELVSFVMTGGKKKEEEDQREQLEPLKTLTGEHSITQQ